MGVIRAKLERVDLGVLGLRLAEPLEHLVAPLAANVAGDVDPGDVGVEAVGDRVDLTPTQRIDPVECELQVVLCLDAVHLFLVLVAGQTDRTSFREGGARAPPPRRAATGRSHDDEPHSRKKPCEAAGLDRRAAF
jgi:hypothetical protein